MPKPHNTNTSHAIFMAETAPRRNHGHAITNPRVRACSTVVFQRLRKRIEEGFGWTKTVGGLMQVKVRGLDKVRAAFVFAVAAYNIVRLPKLMAARGELRPAP